MKKNLLSFDGGGLFGVGPLQYLSNIDIVPSHLVGTSVGAIIVILKALPYRYTWKQCLDIFTTNSKYIFDIPSIFWKYNPFAPKYDNSKMLALFKTIIGDCKMSDLIYPVTIVLTDTITGKPFIVTNKTDMSIIDVIEYTTCAPSIFKIRGQYIDGSLCNNNPILFGLTDVILRGEYICDYNIISFNTNGDYYNPVMLNKPIPYVFYLPQIIKSIMSAVEESSHMFLSIISKTNEFGYIRISPKTSLPNLPFDDMRIMKQWPEIWQEEYESSKHIIKEFLG